MAMHPEIENAPPQTGLRNRRRNGPRIPAASLSPGGSQLTRGTGAGIAVDTKSEKGAKVVADEAVRGEPVSGVKFPVLREFAGNFRRTGAA
jgi:hypothetical protein